MASSQKTAITNVQVFDGETLTQLKTVFIDGGVIVGEVEGAVEVDGQGGVLLPGLFDAHIHLQSADDLRLLAKYGVTTGLDMATWPVEKLNVLRGRPGLADIRSAGLPATVPGSVHSHLLPLPQQALLSTPADAPTFVRDRVAEGSDYIKVISDVPGPSQEILDAVVSEAHDHQKMVVAHAASYDPFCMALNSGADVITHVPCDRPVDSVLTARMIKQGCVACPTLTMMKSVVKPPKLSMLIPFLLRPFTLWAIIQAKRNQPYGGLNYEHARDSVTAMYAAGVPILAGTDCNSEKGNPFQVKHGESIHYELELLVEAGLSNVDALRSATSLPAKYFGLTDRGLIAVGKRADLVLISGNPLEDIRATRSIQRVWCGGIEFKDPGL